MSGVQPRTFQSGGKISQHFIPGTYVRRDFQPNRSGGASTGNTCIVGPSALGEPHKLLVFSGTDEAREVLESGKGLEGVLQAFSPGGDLSPQQVGFMRVNQGTQSARTLSKGATDIFTVSSFSYGSPMNQVRLKVSAGTTAGTKKLETEYKTQNAEIDNIERPSFTLEYTGGGTSSDVTIDETSISLAVVGGAAEDSFSVNFVDFPKINDLVVFLDNKVNYTASLLEDGENESADLDYVSAVDVLTTKTLKSDYAALFDALNAMPFLGVAVKAGVEREIPENDVDFVYLTGAVSGTETTLDYTEAFNLLEQENIQLIATTSEDSAVHVLLRNHCIATNSVEGRRERQFYVGGAAGEDVGAVNSRASLLNSSFGSLCYPGFYDFDEAGNEKLYSPAFFACKQIGAVSALALNNPTTNKSVSIIRWETDLTASDLNSLIPGGVLAGGKDQSGNHISIRSVTTNQGNKLQENEASIMRESLYQSADLRGRLNSLIGTPNIGDAQLATVDSIFESTITDWFNLQIIVSSDGGRFYSGYTRRIVGDVIEIKYNTWNTAPTNFIFVAHKISVRIDQ